MPAAPDTIETLLRQAAAIDRVDAEWLLAHALERPRAWLFAHAGDPVPAETAERYTALLARREAGEPVADIIDPTAGTVHTVRAGTAGVLYARILHRYIQAGLEIGKIAGSTPFRTGNLLGN